MESIPETAQPSSSLPPARIQLGRLEAERALGTIQGIVALADAPQADPCIIVSHIAQIAVLALGRMESVGRL